MKYLFFVVVISIETFYRIKGNIYTVIGKGFKIEEEDEEKKKISCYGFNIFFMFK